MVEDILIDDEWISEFNEDERKYGQFYKEPNAFISLQFIYINSKREIEYTTQRNHQLDKENVLLASSLNRVIVERNCLNAHGYRLYKLLLYNISIEPEEIISDNFNKIPSELREITEIRDIAIEDSINYLKSINTLFFVFVEDEQQEIKINKQPIGVSLNKGSRRRKRHL